MNAKASSSFVNKTREFVNKIPVTYDSTASRRRSGTGFHFPGSSLADSRGFFIAFFEVANMNCVEFLLSGSVKRASWNVKICAF